MEQLRKKNPNSIVSERLILFHALEQGRPRAADGAPLLLNKNFIFNRNLSPEIIAEIEKGHSSSVKIDNSTLYPIYENFEKNSAMEVRQPDENPQPSYSVKYLRSLFEGSSVPLTARNSLERENIVKPRQSAYVRQNGSAVLSKKKEHKNILECQSLRVDEESPDRNDGSAILSQSEEKMNVNEETTSEDLSSSTLATGENLISSPNESGIDGENDSLHVKTSNSESTELLSSSSQLDQSKQQKSKEKETENQQEFPDTKECAETEHKERNFMKVTDSARPAAKRPMENMKSVYVEPSFSVRDETSKPTVPYKPVKQHSLGRGDIKPYEIVDLVDTRKSQSSKTSSRMESVYIEAFGNKTSNTDDDGYQVIGECSQPNAAVNSGLESNEFDLSNIESNVSSCTENSSSGNILEFEHDSFEQNYENIKKDSNSRKGFSVGFDLNESLNGSSLSTSIYSDYAEGWESDEFDDFTDDDVLDEPRPRAKTNDGDNTKKKIFNIVNEILTTEKAYEKRLYLLDQIFQARLMKEAKENPNIPERAILEIFSNLSSIYTFHSTMLLPDLEKRIANWSSNEKIGDIFKTLGHCLKLYTDYVKNFEHATTTLNQWMKKSAKFATIIEDVQKLPECENLNLQHHMLEPIQRVPRYKLLLQDYLKKLPKDAADRSEAEESLVVISKAADHANESMKGMDKFKKLLELEERIVEGLRGETLATPSRVFLKEGELVKIAARSDQKNVRVLLLFNDLLLCCNKVPPTGKLKVKQMMDVPGMTLQDGCDVDLGEAHSFRIKSRQRVLDLAASCDEEKSEWFDAISSVIADYAAKRGTLLKQSMEEDARKEAGRSGSIKVGQAAPVWVKDEDVTMCMLCAVRFSILIRRHHCRACGRIVCDNCSKYKAALSYNNMVKRVCYVCHRKLNTDKIQETDSFILKKTTIDRVARDPKRRRSTMVSEINGELLWKPPGKGWHKGWFVISDLVLYVHKGKKDPKAQMTIALPGYSVSKATTSDEVDEIKHPHVFKVHFGNKKEMTYFFEAEDETRMQRWIDVITYSIKAEKPPPSSKTL